MPINEILIPESIALVDNQFIPEDRAKYPGQLALTGKLLMHDLCAPESETSLEHYASSGSPFHREANGRLLQLISDFEQFLRGRGHVTAVMDNFVDLSIDISKGAPRGLEHLFENHHLKYIFDVRFPVDDPSNPEFRVGPSTITELHPTRSGRMTGLGFYDVARSKSNAILVAYANLIKPGIAAPDGY